MNGAAHNVLICPVGQSYGAVTEALWCMLSAAAKGDPSDPAAIVPDTIRVLTTQPGGGLGAPPDRDRRDREGNPMPAEILLADARDAAREAGELENDAEGGPGAERLSAYRWLLHSKINLLYRSFGQQPPVFTLEPARDSRGHPLPDAFTAQQGADFEAAFLSLMINSVSIDAKAGKQPGNEIDPKTLTRFERDPDTRMHVLMAGGRKYMASAARALVRDVAELGDKLWDVQVIPEQIQYAGLWWPGHFHDGEATTEFRGQQIAGDVRLVDFPFIPGNPTARDIREAHPSLAYGYAVQVAADARDGAPPIEVDLRAKTIRCRDEALVVGETRVPTDTGRYTFQFNHFYLLVIFFMCRKQGVGRFGQVGNDDSGWITQYQRDRYNYKAHSEMQDFKRVLEEISDWRIESYNCETGRIENAEFSNKVRQQLELDYSLPFFSARDMTYIRKILELHPYLQKRLGLERTRLAIELNDENDDPNMVETTAYRISAHPEELRILVNGEPV